MSNRLRTFASRTIFFFLLFVPLFTTTGHTAESEVSQKTRPLKVLRITPAAKDIAPARQIVIRFNRAVVPLGRMERENSEIPITITPKLNCEWRWMDTTSLVCQLGEKEIMKPATRYKMTIRPGIKAEDGATIERVYGHQFITTRPHSTSFHVNQWLAPGRPVIYIRFNLPVTLDSVKRALSIRGSKIDIVEYPKQETPANASYAFLITPVHEFPLDTKVGLHVSPGLVTPQGPERGIENKTVFQFRTHTTFRFIKATCYDIQNNYHNAGSGSCDPDGRVTLHYSLPASYKDDKSVQTKTEGVETVKVTSSYVGPFKPKETYRLQANPVDRFGRKLPAPVDVTFTTSHRRPKFHLNHRVSTLEQDEPSDAVITVRNIDEVKASYSTLTADGITGNQSRTFRPEKPMDVDYGIPLGSREMLAGKSGAVSGTISSTPSNNNYTNSQWFFSQVTPYQVIAKVGHFNTTVWVTDMKSGEVVENADVSIFESDRCNLGLKQKILSVSKTDEDGVATLAGIKTVDPNFSYSTNCWNGHGGEPSLNIRVQKKEETAFVPLHHSFAVDSYRVTGVTHPNRKRIYGHIHAWGTTAQGVYKAGEKIEYKIYVRDQSNKSLVPAPKGKYHLIVFDPMSKIAHEEKDIELNEFGAIDGAFTTPKNAAVGWYSFHLKPSFTGYSTWWPLKVLVTDFTPSPFRVETSLNGDLFRQGDEIEVLTSAKLHSGGPYVDAKSRVTATFVPRSFSSDNPKVKGFHFETGNGNNKYNLFQLDEKIDEKGELLTKIPLQQVPGYYGKIRIESSVQDDRGKSVASIASADYRGVDRMVGLKHTKWVYKENKKEKLNFFVVNEKGDPVEGEDVAIAIQRHETTAMKVKSAGNAYITRYSSKWVDAGKCDETSGKKAGECKFTPDKPGWYQFRASVNDTKERLHSTSLYAYVVGKGRVMWESGTGHSLQIVPEKNSYKIGEKARYMVKNPLPGAKAFITVERYGVLKSWVTTFEKSAEIVEFTVEPDFMPGYFLSVTLVSPRIEEMSGFGKLDLGKPTFRMGYVQTDVRDPYKEIVVEAKAVKKEYRPRDEVVVNIKASPRMKKKRGKKEEIELAVVALDESVFDLIKGGEGYFDPYKGFYTLDGLDLQNYSLLLNLVGRQKFEKKGANPGGGGGDSGGKFAIRNLFKYVAYWNPSIKTDSRGRAKIKFNAPDNLTGWRVLVMAVTPTDRMGLGRATFKVNKPTEIRPVMPNQVTEGDRFKAGFTVMNRTDKTRKVKVEVEASGDIKSATDKKVIKKTVTLEPFKRKKVWIDIKAGQVAKKRDVPQGKITFVAKAWDSFDSDATVHSLPVNKRRSLLTAANYGTTTEDKVTESIHFPKSIRGDAGSVSVVLSPSVIGNVRGAFEYMRNYPYACWEQKMTTAVMASHYLNLKKYISDDFAWGDATRLPQATLNLSSSYQAPNGGMVYYVPRDAYVSPYLSAYTALAFGWLRDSGHKVPEQVETKLHNYLLRMLRNEVFPNYFSDGMKSTVRGVALAALAKSGKLKKSDIDRYIPHYKSMSLFGKAHFLQAALTFDVTEDEIQSYVDTILGYSSQTAGKFMFNEELTNDYYRILATPLRSNCAVLTGLTSYAQERGGREYIGDVPFKMVRAITQTRAGKPHFENTQENMFCMNALVDYSKAYESVEPDMVITASMDNKSFGKVRIDDLRDKPTTLDRPISADDPGRKTKVVIEKKGEGRFYYSTRLQYAPLDKFSKRTNAGIEIRKEYSVKRENKWVKLDDDSLIKRGEVVLVNIFLSIPTARHFVVVDDPVPGGLEPVNSDLATASTVDAEAGAFIASDNSFFYGRSDWFYYNYSRWSFYHRELRHNAVRFYSDYLSPGNYALSYTAQAIATGKFAKMPVHAEEMYDPDVFGKGLSSTLRISE